MKTRSKTRQLILRCIAFGPPLLLMLALLSCLFIPKNNFESFGMGQARANGILAEPENTIDVLIVGDSESYSTFSPIQMWGEQGFTSYVCGTSGQRLCDSCEFVKKTFRSQQPRVVVLETNAIFRSIRAKQAIFNAAAELLPVFRYHDRWKSLNINDFQTTPNYTNVVSYKGFHCKALVKDGSKKDYMQSSPREKRIRPVNLVYLKELQRLCKENDAQLLLVSTPSTLNWNAEKHNGIETYADAHSLTYLDMNLLNDEIGIDWEADSRDGGDHLNLSGAEKASTYFGIWLKEQYALPDHREDSDYENWNRLLEKYRKDLDKAWASALENQGNAK